MDTKTYYYHVDRECEEPHICCTSKEYWDANHFVDDGGSDGYVGFTEAMESCGAGELTESMYEIPAMGMDALVRTMAAMGYRLVQDAAFSAYLSRI